METKRDMLLNGLADYSTGLEAMCEQVQSDKQFEQLMQTDADVVRAYQACFTHSLDEEAASVSSFVEAFGESESFKGRVKFQINSWGNALNLTWSGLLNIAEASYENDELGDKLFDFNPKSVSSVYDSRNPFHKNGPLGQKQRFHELMVAINQKMRNKR